MKLLMRGRYHSPQLNGIAKIKNHTLTKFVNVMLETVGHAKDWWRATIFTMSRVTYEEQ